MRREGNRRGEEEGREGEGKGGEGHERGKEKGGEGRGGTKENNPHIYYGQLIFVQGGKSMQRGKDILFIM